MNKTLKALQEGGRKGGLRKKANFDKKRQGLIEELSKHVPKSTLEAIQMSRVPWTNEEIRDFIKKYFKK